MTETEAKRLLSGSLRLGDEEQLRAKHLLDGLQCAKEQYGTCKQNHIQEVYCNECEDGELADGSECAACCGCGVVEELAIHNCDCMDGIAIDVIDELARQVAAGEFGKTKVDAEDILT